MARPKAFHEGQALEAAMACFWERGYEATSVRDLTERMGIASPSLYNAFGDKRSLFKQTLELYCEQLTLERLARIDAEFAPRDRIAAFFGEIVARSMDDPQRRGCFLINSAIEVAPHDAELGELIGAYLEQVRSFFARSLRDAHTAGDIAPAIDVDKAAAHLMALLLGIRVLARTRPEAALLEGIVASALEPLGLAIPPVAGRGRH